MPEADRRRSWIVAGTGAALFTAALLVLRRELTQLSYHQLTDALFAIPGRRLALPRVLANVSALISGGYRRMLLK